MPVRLIGKDWAGQVAKALGGTYFFWTGAGAKRFYLCLLLGKGWESCRRGNVASCTGETAPAAASESTLQPKQRALCRLQVARRSTSG